MELVRAGHLQPKDVTTEQQPSMSYLLCALLFLPLPPLQTDIHHLKERLHRALSLGS